MLWCEHAMLYLDPTVMFSVYLLLFPSYFLSSLLALVFCYLFQRSASVVESVKLFLQKSCYYKSAFMYHEDIVLVLYTNTNIIPCVEKLLSVDNKQYCWNITQFAAINKLTTMIYLYCQKLDTNWHADVKWLLVNERRKPQMEGVVQIQFIFIALFTREHTTSLLCHFPPGETKSLPQRHTSSSLEKQKASAKISLVSYLMIFHFKFICFIKFCIVRFHHCAYWMPEQKKTSIIDWVYRSCKHDKMIKT